MQHIKPNVSTICVGIAASMASVLLAAGAKGKRFILPNAEVMIHQPHGGIGGQVTDIEIQAAEIEADRRRLNEILARHTGQPVEVIARETERDRYFHAQSAKEFGLVDDILTKAPPEEKKPG